jgi:hypothetical protein
LGLGGDVAVVHYVGDVVGIYDYGVSVGSFYRRSWGWNMCFPLAGLAERGFFADGLADVVVTGVVAQVVADFVGGFV